MWCFWVEHSGSYLCKLLSVIVEGQIKCSWLSKLLLLRRSFVSSTFNSFFSYNHFDSSFEILVFFFALNKEVWHSLKKLYWRHLKILLRAKVKPTDNQLEKQKLRRYHPSWTKVLYFYNRISTSRSILYCRYWVTFMQLFCSLDKTLICLFCYLFCSTSIWV
jgi:hypothetical protein